jgi:hypothetical protein
MPSPDWRVTVFRNGIVSAFNSAVNCLDGTC